MHRTDAKRGSNKVPYRPLGIVVSIAIVLSVFSYVYFISTSNQIDKIVTDDLRRQNKAEAQHISEVLTSELRVVVSNTFTAADAPLIRSGDVERGNQAINIRQAATDYLTDRYLWIDENGKTLWSSAFVNTTEYELYKGFDVSSRPYFVNPARTHEPFFSPVVQSPVDKSQRMFISYPIFAEPMTQTMAAKTDPAGENSPIFKGVIVSSIRADKLYEVIKSKLSTESQSSVGIVDPNGIIVYSTVSSIIGENVFGDQVQSIVSQAFPSDKVGDFNDFLKRSIQGQADSKDIDGGQGQISSMTSLPISLQFPKSKNGDNTIETGEVHFLTFYLITPHNISEKIGPLIEQQRNLTTSIIATIGAITAAFSYVLVAGNKNLARKVDERTASLNEANKSLSQSIEDLAGKTKELEQANEDLKIHDKLQKEFVNIAAHELRTPIQPLLGAADLLESQLEEKDKIEVTRAEIDMILRNARRLERLSSDILEMSRVESGLLKLNKEEFSLSYIIAEAVKDAKAQSFIDADKVTIKYNPDDIFVFADRDKITQVITNLLTNALKFTDEGTISITTQRNDDNNVIVSVKDAGPGIDPEILPKLFEKFVAKSDRGTGIGLYLSKKIIEAHGGSISGENNALGNGATFKFSLPLLQQNAEKENNGLFTS